MLEGCQGIVMWACLYTLANIMPLSYYPILRTGIKLDAAFVKSISEHLKQLKKNKTITNLWHKQQTHSLAWCDKIVGLAGNEKIILALVIGIWNSWAIENSNHVCWRKTNLSLAQQKKEKTQNKTENFFNTKEWMLIVFFVYFFHYSVTAWIFFFTINVVGLCLNIYGSF